MKMENKNEIDWVTAREYGSKILTKAKSDLESRLPKLKLIKPSIGIKERSPILCFNYVSKYDNKIISENENDELKEKLQEIAKLVNQVAEENNLTVYEICDRIGNYPQGFIEYQLSPNYQEFAIKK